MAEMSERCMRTTDIGAYLLGGLSPSEANDMRLHADTCTYCAAEMAALRPLVERLADTDLSSITGQPRLEPPAELRDRILLRASLDVPSPLAVDARRDDPSIVDLTDRNMAGSRPIRRRWHRGAVGLAVIGIFGLGVGSGVGMQAALDDPPPTTAYDPSWGNGERVTFAAQTSQNPSKRAWAWIGSGDAGTYAVLYTKGLNAGETYRWWFERADGTRVGLGSFIVPAGQTTWLKCPGSTSIAREELVVIGATDSQGIDVLRSKLPVVTT
jgi:hypothetical protein